MKTVSIVIILLLGLITVGTGTDYCSPNLCSGAEHIGCGNNGEFSSQCPAGQTKMVTMTDALKAKIIDSHNSKRDTIADGRLPGFKTATRMATMQWSDELSLLASYNVKRCKFAHDNCRNTDLFNYSGQNLGKFWWSGFFDSEEGIILARIDDWWSEHKDATMSDIDRYQTLAKIIGHFTVMAADKNIAVGCAAVRFPENGMSSLSIACNYATTNILDKPIYASGQTASECTTGKHPTYPALCSTAEVYNVNAI